MGKCCVVGCTSGDNVEYFKFPAGKALRAAWLAACGGAGAVCAAHFAADDYTCTRGARRLRGGAVPRTQCAPSKAVTKDNTKDADKQTDAQKDETAPETVTGEVKDATGDDGDKIEKVKDKSNSKDGDNRAEVSAKERGKESAESAQSEEKDIEEMITNYQIKQTKTLADRLNPEPLEDLIPSIMADPARLDQLAKSLPNSTANNMATGSSNNVANSSSNNTPNSSKWDRQAAKQLASQLASKLGRQLDGMLSGTTPVFIEVPVTKEAAASRAASPADCVMLLESVQCEVDPSSLMLPERAPDTDSDMEIVSYDRKEDPISLLTSSDEDEVIIEEPHIDTVDVSDETDEDDKPLTALVKTAQDKPDKYCNMCEWVCIECNFKPEGEESKHKLDLENSRTIYICPVCNYTTASKAQYSRHKRKHRDERNFKCHLCNYKARHNMSLMYHLKSHEATSERRPKFACDKCGFSSHLKSEGLEHIRVCDEGRLFCDSCAYSTRRRGDLRRHRRRRHSADDDDEDFRA